MLLFIILLVVVIVTIIGIHEKNTNALCKSNKQLNGKVAVVTGGTAGMGLEISRELAKRGAKVIIACPFDEEGVSAQKAIIEATNNNKVIFKFLDLASLDSVRKFADDILKTEERLDLLINNAGVGIPVNTKSYNGTNFIMQVNYIGHFLLTLLLLPLLKKSGTSGDPSRIVNTASLLHWLGKVNYHFEASQGFWYRLFCYGNSKYCFVLFGHELSKRLKGSNVVVNAVDPGAVGTGIFASLSIFGSFIRLFFKNVFKTPWEGCQTALHVALDQNAGKLTGQFFKNCKLSRAKKSAYDDKLSEKLWHDSIKMVRLEDSKVPVRQF